MSLPLAEGECRFVDANAGSEDGRYGEVNLVPMYTWPYTQMQVAALITAFMAVGSVVAFALGSWRRNALCILGV